MVVSILITYTNHHLRKKGPRCSCCATPFKMVTGRIPPNKSNEKTKCVCDILSQTCQKRRRKPTCLIICRQTCPECSRSWTILTRTKAPAAAMRKK